MYSETVKKAVYISQTKIEFLNKNFIGYIVASCLSGIFIGLGVVLIFSIAAPFFAIGSPAVKLIMGACFGIALTIVIFAGCELFTSNVMFMTIGLVWRKVSFTDSLRIWIISWLGGLLGSLIIAFIVFKGGSIEHAYNLFKNVALSKVLASEIELFARGVLCNMLVCLAVWICLRTENDAAKMIAIFWCLFGFIGAGFEHSIANMSLIALAIYANGADQILNWQSMGYNLLWVTFGNFIGGAVFIAIPYLIASKTQQKVEEPSAI
jgi:nitrite transporter NirC